MEVILREKYMNPLSDFAFKKLFFNELNKELLIDFLNEVLQEKDRIADIQYLPATQLGDWETDRKVIFDIFCINDKNEYLIIEMQKAKRPHFRNRCLFYATFPLRKQAPQGPWNYDLKAVYTIAIMDFVLFNECDEDDNHCIERAYLLRNRTKTLFSDKLNFVFVELPKFRKEANELATNMDRWLFCLKNLSKLDDRPAEVQGRIFEKLFKVAEIQQLTTKEMEEYKKSIMDYEDVRDATDCARQEGRVDEKIKIAKKCLSKGMSIEEIIALTELSSEEIKKLK